MSGHFSESILSPIIIMSTYMIHILNHLSLLVVYSQYTVFIIIQDVWDLIYCTLCECRYLRIRRYIFKQQGTYFNPLYESIIFKVIPQQLILLSLHLSAIALLSPYLILISFNPLMYLMPREIFAFAYIIISYQEKYIVNQ